jgi:hypothetical protein
MIFKILWVILIALGIVIIGGGTIIWFGAIIFEGVPALRHMLVNTGKISNLDEALAKAQEMDDQYGYKAADIRRIEEEIKVAKKDVKDKWKDIKELIFLPCLLFRMMIEMFHRFWRMIWIIKEKK